MKKPKRIETTIGLTAVSSNDWWDSSMPMNSDLQVELNTRWATSDGLMFYSVPKSRSKISAGTYTVGVSNQLGPYFSYHPIITDDLVELNDSVAMKVVAEFEKFWNSSDAFKSRGFLKKRGFLLWGPPGSGKTSCLNTIMRYAVEKMDAVVVLFNGNPSEGTEGLMLLRRIEPDRKIIVVMEDIDTLISMYGESRYLEMLDGEYQLDNVVYMATSNYPEKLDKRFVDRPSRFDTVWKIGMPEERLRREYLKSKEPDLTPDELEFWVTKTEGYSIAHLKELIIAVKCLGQDIDDVLNRLDRFAPAPKSGDAESTNDNFGFGITKKN